MNTSLKERALIKILPRKRDFARRKSLLPDGRNGLPWMFVSAGSLNVLVDFLEDDYMEYV